MSGRKADSRHRTSAIYQLALSELRERHADEFNAIYDQLLKEAGIETVTAAERRIKRQLVELVRDEPGVTRSALIHRLAVRPSTFDIYIRKLRDVGVLGTAGRGSRSGYFVLPGAAQRFLEETAA